ncbi:DMT family protein [soil metagenome]
MLAEWLVGKHLGAMRFSFSYIAPVLMLVASNVFMTFAWYGHLKFGSKPLWLVVMVSWGIALFEYCLAVPANRIGHSVYSTAELKTMQEVITLLVFAVFSVTFLGERLTLNHAVGFGLIFGGAWFIFRGPF